MSAQFHHFKGFKLDKKNWVDKILDPSMKLILSPASHCRSPTLLSSLPCPGFSSGFHTCQLKISFPYLPSKLVWDSCYVGMLQCQNLLWVFWKDGKIKDQRVQGVNIALIRLIYSDWQKKWPMKVDENYDDHEAFQKVETCRWILGRASCSGILSCKSFEFRELKSLKWKNMNMKY